MKNHNEDSASKNKYFEVVPGLFKQLLFFAVLLLILLNLENCIGRKYIPIEPDHLALLEATSTTRTAVLTRDRPRGRNPTTFLSIDGEYYWYLRKGFTRIILDDDLDTELEAYFYNDRLISIYRGNELIYRQHPDTDERKSK